MRPTGRQIPIAQPGGVKPSRRKTAMDERILATADRLFSRRGIRAVGVDTIAAKTGISKRTLYNHYPSKEALVLAHLRRRFGALTTADEGFAGAPPADQILGAFERLERAIGHPAFRGCPFVNAVAELGEASFKANTDTNVIAIAFKEERRLWFRRRLDRLGVADPDGLATQLAILVDGCVAVGLVRRDPGMARAARAAARTLLAAAGVSVTG
jgi:AcrR family transcriptional regulator